MEFEKYQHIERWGHKEVEGIEHGTCWVFPKLDGTNASLWWDGELRAGSRTRALSLDHDNAGFCAWAREHRLAGPFLFSTPHLRIFGEWMVPHTLKTYREDAWRRFYVFDVFDHEQGRLLRFEEYDPLMRQAGLDVIQPLCTIENPAESNIVHEVNQNTYLIQDGAGVGEGVVVKNYDFTNRFGAQKWAKFVRSEFKEQNRLAFGVCAKTGEKMTEAALAEKFVTPTLVQKTRAKVELDVLNAKGIAPGTDEADLAICNARGQVIPRLLQTVFYEVVNEEMWSMLKTLKGGNQVIDFRRLSAQSAVQTKRHAGDLF